MSLKHYLVIVFFGFSCSLQAQKNYDIRTIAFYNVENLFDTINNPKTFDDERTPQGRYTYNSEVYWDKIAKLSKVISEIGSEKTQMSPVIVGLCEVENKNVLKDLINSSNLKDKGYQFIHQDSPDERGIDVAFLYRKQFFKPLSYKTYELLLYNEDNFRDYTRDQLVVSGLLENDLMYLIVNHWPSRRGGKQKSNHLRMTAAKLNLKIMDSIRKETKNAKIITMGDFNDDPTDPSIQKVLKTRSKKNDLKWYELYNPMEDMHRRGFNTLAYKDQLNLFDQIIVSQPFLEKQGEGYHFFKAGIYNKKYLTNHKGRFKNYPLRSYNFNTYQGGYSDHFPVYLYLIKEQN